jgi:signal transduction histidine kinase
MRSASPGAFKPDLKRHQVLAERRRDQNPGQVHPQQVVICVSDQGSNCCGDIPYIFDRFYRAQEASRTTKGAGLGLYLARAVVEAHGGRIWVDSKSGEGARICFSLPRDDSRRV